MNNARVIGLLILATAPMVGCETAASRQAAEERNNKKAAEQLSHLCSLPFEQREVEMEKLQRNHGVTIVCPPDTSNATP